LIIFWIYLHCFIEPIVTTHIMAQHILVEPREVVSRAFSFMQIDPQKKWSHERRAKQFAKHFGPPPLTIATQWYDLCHADIEGKAKLTEKEQKLGFRSFLAAHYFLWNYTRNADQLAAYFHMCERYARGAPLWDWIKHVAALEKKVIVWPKELDSDDTEVTAISVDGVDKKSWKHPTETLNLDPKNYTQKHGCDGSKWQLTLAAHRQQCVHIYGPVRGGMSDKEMLTRSGVLKRLRKGKLACADRGYIAKKFVNQVSWPNVHDSPAVNNHKSRIRLRHESFNGKMSKYASMSHTWTHTTEQHGIAFRAVAVTIQYSMNDGNNRLFQA
jgi:hypothetical protein